jgi:GNAT superfamily N-acetyltransferase
MKKHAAISRGYTPGDIGRVVELHGRYYHEHWKFGYFFECKVASELCKFLGRYDPKRDGFWSLKVHGRLEGSIAIDAVGSESEGAHLRWFIVSEGWRGGGYGNRLIGEAVGFCRAKAYRKIYLWTFAGLDAARHLYAKNGFALVEQKKGRQWGPEVDEQRFELLLAQAPAGHF